MPHSASLRARRHHSDAAQHPSPDATSASDSPQRPHLTLWQRIVGNVPAEHVRTVSVQSDEAMEAEVVIDTGGSPADGDTIVVHDPEKNENTEHPWHPSVPVPMSLHPLGISLAIVAVRRASTR